MKEAALGDTGLTTQIVDGSGRIPLAAKHMQCGIQNAASRRLPFAGCGRFRWGRLKCWIADFAFIGFHVSAVRVTYFDLEHQEHTNWYGNHNLNQLVGMFNKNKTRLTALLHEVICNELNGRLQSSKDSLPCVTYKSIKGTTLCVQQPM